MSDLFRTIPAVDTLLADSRVQDAALGLSAAETTHLIRLFLSEVRDKIKDRQAPLSEIEIIEGLLKYLAKSKRQKSQEVINATGVLLHTNLGRAPLPRAALERLFHLGSRYFNLELNLQTGARGSRYTTAAALFNLLNAEAAADLDTVIVNNNAAAVLVTLKSLAAGSEVIVSRGQLVEIGGGFRVPEVIATSGCILKEVGTTNRTRLADYERAITPETKAILLVHPSNYSIIGFTESAAREDLARLAQERGLILIEDIGSGAFKPFEEPLVPTALKHSDIVTYSGDKLLGGPQAGIISGKRKLIEIIKKEPLLRAVRIDKLSLLALEAVLEIYLNKEYGKLPLWQLASVPAAEIKARAENWLAHLGRGLTGEIKPSRATMGGGSLPGETIPSWSLVLQSPTLSGGELAALLRRSEPAVMGRILKDQVWLDPRTVLLEQEEALLKILERGVNTCS